jgi:hypothetical protein
MLPRSACLHWPADRRTRRCIHDAAATPRTGTRSEPNLRARLEALKNEQNRAAAQLERITSSTSIDAGRGQVTAERLERFANAFREKLRDPEFRRSYLRHIIARIDVGDDEVIVVGSTDQLAKAASGTNRDDGAGVPSFIPEWRPQGTEIRTGIDD